MLLDVGRDAEFVEGGAVGGLDGGCVRAVSGRVLEGRFWFVMLLLGGVGRFSTHMLRSSSSDFLLIVLAKKWLNVQFGNVGTMI